MNYYPFHIGDYAVHTRHLSLMEDLAYRRLIDWYYIHERPIPAETQSVARLIGMREHVVEIDAVLREFFEPNEAGQWINSRCEAEIVKAQAAAARARKNGQSGGRPSKSKASGGPPAQPTLPKTQPVSGGSPDESKSKAPNPKTNTKPKGKGSAVAPRPSVNPSVLLEAGFDAQAAADFIAHKEAVKAPLTERAWKDHVREAGKAGWTPSQAAEKVMAKGWKGFEAKYVASEAPPSVARRPAGPEPVHGNAAPDAAATQRMLAEQAKVRPAKPSPELAAALKSLASPQRSAA